jgi:regulator of sigma E protease
MIISILLTVLAIIITILVLVGIHEFGHFIIARVVGVKVLRYALGFGKVLWSKRDSKQTEYAVCLFPLGGYVQLLDSREKPVAPEEVLYDFSAQAAWKRFAIIIAGPCANLLFAIICFWLLLLSDTTIVKPVIAATTPNSIAANAKIVVPSEIIAIDNHPVLSWQQVLFRLLLRAGDQAPLTIDLQTKANQIVQYTLPLTQWHLSELNPDPLSSLGFVPYQPTIPVNAKGDAINFWPPAMLRHLQFGMIGAFLHSIKTCSFLLYFQFVMLGKLLIGKLSLKTLSGPLSIFEGVDIAIKISIKAFLNFLALISVSIAFINFLPIPGLDGSHLLFIVIEKIRGRALSVAAQVLAFRLGMIILVLLLIQALMNDILRLST